MNNTAVSNSNNDEGTVNNVSEREILNSDGSGVTIHQPSTRTATHTDSASPASSSNRSLCIQNTPTRNSNVSTRQLAFSMAGRDTPSSIRSLASFPLYSENSHMSSILSKAKKENDSMIYIDGPQVYSCAQCRTHLTSHDDIISKSFHGRHGRAYLFDQCVNVTKGVEENRRLMTGLHVVCDIFCKRCKRLVGWTYSKAYEPSQKYKEGKFIIEKINLHIEESSYYDISHPAGERDDRWRKRSMSWGSDHHSSASCGDSPSPFGSPSASARRNSFHDDMVYEYKPSSLKSPSTSYESPRVGRLSHSPHDVSNLSSSNSLKTPDRSTRRNRRDRDEITPLSPSALPHPPF